ncbi:MAG: SUMF1/EgtB/PvdO family nonheme iron enzyme [Chitinophagales bacterium]|nr:SUMF1/EgtB/PvdO family nonheme iron enzyme [Chitinophagales bacterium]
MKNLQNLVGNAVAVSVLFLAGCSGGYNGQLIGELNRPRWNPITPYGMVFIPSGVLHIGPGDQDVNSAYNAKAKQISVVGFYMDDTEITNNEYRQFVNWVRDSAAHTFLEHTIEREDGKTQLDWKQKIEWNGKETNEQLEQIYYPENQRIWGRMEIDPNKLHYVYEWYDLKGASLTKNRGKDRTAFIKKENVMIYPDTLCWVRDFTYSYNEPMTRHYFSHPAFDDYPVVGVNWYQAKAFCAWRTRFWEDYKTAKGEPLLDEFRLPTEFEWEYAARGGKKHQPYPWGGPYVRNSKGCILANFKPGRGNYPEDGGFYTVRADAYWPNDFGLYNMAGNVAEWTSSAFYENAYSFIHDLNPDIRYDAEANESETLKRKSIRGGSWKDIGYYIECGTRHWEYADSAKSYIGFRCITTFLGRDIMDSK